MSLRQEMEYHACGKESVAAFAHKAKTTESKQRRLYLYQREEEYKQIAMCECESS